MISALGLHEAKSNNRLYKPQSSLLAWNSPSLRLYGHAQIVSDPLCHCFPPSLLKKPAGLLTPGSPTPVGLEPGPHFVISQPSPCVPPLRFFNSQKLSISLWPVTLFLRFTSWHARSWGLSRFIALQSPLQKVTTLSVIYCFYVQEPTKSTMSFINVYTPKPKWFQRPPKGVI